MSDWLSGFLLCLPFSRPAAPPQSVVRQPGMGLRGLADESTGHTWLIRGKAAKLRDGSGDERMEEEEEEEEGPFWPLVS
ncbi:hypothetical protein ACJZ2D_005190 [Fusarium nematophilum]